MEILNKLIEDCNSFENSYFLEHLAESLINNKEIISGIKDDLQNRMNLNLPLEDLMVCYMVIGMSIRNKTFLENLQLEKYKFEKVEDIKFN